jgi:hypothetical protein
VFTGISDDKEDGVKSCTINDLWELKQQHCFNLKYVDEVVIADLMF